MKSKMCVTIEIDIFTKLLDSVEAHVYNTVHIETLIQPIQTNVFDKIENNLRERYET